MAGVNRIGQYMLGETLGSGSFGKVKEATHGITGHKVAVKILNREQVKDLDMVGKIKREMQILKMFRHPHIIKLYQVISSPTDIFMVMEYVGGGELFDYILKHGRVSEDIARKFFQQIISGVDYCHRHMVVHRDLKPENLLLDENHNVRIADFGLSNMMTDGDFLTTSCGSPNYAAPEVISGRLYAGPEVDVWSSGVILYVLICGRLPFDDEYVPNLFKKIKNGQYTIPPHVSEGARALIVSMLRVDPVKRATIDDIKCNEWFRVDLPEYIARLFESGKYDVTTGFDEQAVHDICSKFQLYGDQVVQALQQKDPQDQIMIAYKLLLDNRRIAAAGHQPFKPEEAEVSDAHFLDQKLRKPTRAIEPTGVQRPPILVSAAEAARTTKSTKRSRWHLGMRSTNNPEEIMAEVYRAMKQLNFQWKVITPFHARCRCWNQVSGTLIKMSLQLYKADHRNYLLDFRNLPSRASDRLQLLEEAEFDTDMDSQNEGIHTLEFFELCAMLIMELGR